MSGAELPELPGLPVPAMYHTSHQVTPGSPKRVVRDGGAPSLSVKNPTYFDDGGVDVSRIDLQKRKLETILREKKNEIFSLICSYADGSDRPENFCLIVGTKIFHFNEEIAVPFKMARLNFSYFLSYVNQDGFTPMALAVQANNLEAIKLFLEPDGSLETADNQTNLFFLAVTCGHTDLALEIFKKIGAGISGEDNEFVAGLQLIVRSRNKPAFHFLAECFLQEKYFTGEFFNLEDLNFWRRSLLNATIQFEVWSSLESLLRQDVYKKAEIWGDFELVRTPFLDAAIKPIERGGETFPNLLSYAINAGYEGIVFYLLAFPGGIPAGVDDLNILTNSENTKLLSGLALVLTAQEACMTPEEASFIDLDLKKMRAKILTAAVVATRTGVLNQALQTDFSLGKSVEVFCLDRCFLRELFLKNSFSRPIKIDGKKRRVSLLEECFLKDYQGLVSFLLVLHGRGVWPLDLDLLGELISQDQEKGGNILGSIFTAYPGFKPEIETVIAQALSLPMPVSPVVGTPASASSASVGASPGLGSPSVSPPGLPALVFGGAVGVGSPAAGMSAVADLVFKVGR